MMGLLPAGLENVAVQCCEELVVGRGAVHERMSRRVYQASLVRAKHLESRREVFGKDGQ
jgi:hypothetical protein